MDVVYLDYEEIHNDDVVVFVVSFCNKWDDTKKHS